MIDELTKAAGRPVSRETLEKIERYAHLLREESSRQNLVSSATLDTLWERHVLDSAQLCRYETRPEASWLDIGSGAGFPGIVIACIVAGRCTLLEPRRLRAEFLHRVVDSLRLEAEVLCSKAEHVSGKYDLITSRAVAPLAKLLGISQHLSTRKTRWVLPKGRGALSELAEAKRTWQGMFHVERSVTDAQSFIVVGKGVRAKT
ncbi:16S rRNA (guanine(527)-N(7))-methyltransferase RsmG [Sphingomonas sp.]|uniref:16S rRNA (guanine(527)-N(7))-methyltransferase RsmG n=1 Tax=Sphingomonas sp. TaxID=28214 RepID=UPI0025E0B359|nr:16S rRNA (guanine(527)-N(7))-methyltransferase RsmG [Sphingomonas sp.]MBV9527272.1 16S rRNA (guanine(527)-N(7))-methyltransferase RsmG [Sphingomonas sp.]